MSFHLAFNPKKSDHKITHQQSLLFIGSCFSEHISHQLSALKFQVSSNPFGIVFNPKSIELLLIRIIEKNYFNEKDILEKEGIFFCLDTHTSFSDTNRDHLLNTLNQTIESWHSKLKTTHWLVITFGSAYAYQDKNQNKVVANCHKLPAAYFTKHLLSVSAIVSDYQLLVDKLKVFNPKLHILFTVSPVKHLRDGIIENNLSKAVLIQSEHHLIEKNNQCSYFPSYELVNDDLRDYRFYEADMAHPNQQAIDYVWKKFENVYFAEKTKLLNDRIQEITAAMNHKPFRIESESFSSFKKTMYRKCQAIIKEEEWLNLDKELTYFSYQRD